MASLTFPLGMAMDGLGNLYFADGGNHRVRRVDPNWVITAVAGDTVREALRGISANAGSRVNSHDGFVCPAAASCRSRYAAGSYCPGVPISRAPA